MSYCDGQDTPTGCKTRTKCTHSASRLVIDQTNNQMHIILCTSSLRSILYDWQQNTCYLHDHHKYLYSINLEFILFDFFCIFLLYEYTILLTIDRTINWSIDRSIEYSIWLSCNHCKAIWFVEKVKLNGIEFHSKTNQLKNDKQMCIMFDFFSYCFFVLSNGAREKEWEKYYVDWLAIKMRTTYRIKTMNVIWNQIKSNGRIDVDPNVSNFIKFI